MDSSCCSSVTYCMPRDLISSLLMHENVVVDPGPGLLQASDAKPIIRVGCLAPFGEPRSQFRLCPGSDEDADDAAGGHRPDFDEPGRLELRGQGSWILAVQQLARRAIIAVRICACVFYKLPFLAELGESLVGDEVVFDPVSFGGAGRPGRIRGHAAHKTGENHPVERGAFAGAARARYYE